MGFTAAQLHAIDAAERISSVFSLLGASFIITSFLFTNKFGRPVNRLIFFGSFGNIAANIATLIGRDSIEHLEGRKTSPICSFQAFSLQTFLPADALFCLCMAINVYLTVIHKYSAAHLRKLELPYVILSYLIPFISGITLLLIKTEEKGPVYGNAVLWCWISPKWDLLRLTTFYGPVWLIIIITFFLYVFTGRVIFRMRSTLRQFAAKNGGRVMISGTELQSHLTSQALPSPTAIKMITVTHVEVSSHKVTTPSAQVIDYTCNVTVGDDVPQHGYFEDEKEEFDEERPDSEPRAPKVDLEKFGPTNTESAKRATIRAKKTMKANAAALAYARCAMLFFIGLIITWLPPSMNRVYSYIHKDKSDFNLSFLSGLVLPAQGLWNVIIYCCTSWSSCRSLWDDIMSKFSFQPESQLNTPPKLSPISSTFDRD